MASTHVSPVRVRVASLNVHSASGPERLGKIVDHLVQSGTHVVAIQEISRERGQRIAEMAGFAHVAYAPATFLGNAILSKFPFVNSVQEINSTAEESSPPRRKRFCTTSLDLVLQYSGPDAPKGAGGERRSACLRMVQVPLTLRSRSDDHGGDEKFVLLPVAALHLDDRLESRRVVQMRQALNFVLSERHFTAAVAALPSDHHLPQRGTSKVEPCEPPRHGAQGTPALRNPALHELHRVPAPDTSRPDNFTTTTTSSSISSSEPNEENQQVEFVWTGARQCVLLGDFNALNRDDYTDEQWHAVSAIRVSAHLDPAVDALLQELLKEHALRDSCPDRALNRQLRTRPADHKWKTSELCSVASTCQYGTRVDYILTCPNSKWQPDRSTYRLRDTVLDNATDHNMVIVEMQYSNE